MPWEKKERKKEIGKCLTKLKPSFQVPGLENILCRPYTDSGRDSQCAHPCLLLASVPWTTCRSRGETLQENRALGSITDCKLEGMLTAHRKKMLAILSATNDSKESWGRIFKPGDTFVAEGQRRKGQFSFATFPKERTLGYSSRVFPTCGFLG